MTTKQFHLGDLLSITDGRLLSPDGIDGVYNILNWMTGESLFAHQLPRASKECKPHLLAQHPFLAGGEMKKRLDRLTALLESTSNPKATIDTWMLDAMARFGETHEVEPVPTAHEPRDSIEELQEMAPGKPIIPFTPPQPRK